MPPVYSTNFARADSALGGVADNWSDPTTSWRLLNAAVTSAATGYGSALLLRPAGEAPDRVSVSATVTRDGAGLPSSHMLWCRCDAAGNGYSAWLGAVGTVAPGTDVLALAKMTAGVPSAQTTPAALGSGPWVLTISADGPAVTASVAAKSAPGTVLATLSLADSAYASGRTALSPFGAGASTDDYSVSALAAAPAPTGRAVCDGNSQLVGVGGAASWAVALAAALGPSWDVQNLGVGGQTTQQMAADSATQVVPLLTTAYAAGLVVVAQEVMNDIYYGATGAEAFAHLAAYSAAVRGVNGARLLVVCPQPDRGDFPGTSTLPGADGPAKRAAYQGRVSDFMALFRAGWQTVCDGFFDPGSNASFVVANYQPDGVHWPTALANAVGAGVAALVPQALTPGAAGLTLAALQAELTARGITAGGVNVSKLAGRAISATGSGAGIRMAVADA